MARRTFVPTDGDRKLVEALHGYGLPIKEIATLVENPETGLPISEPIMYKVFRQELDAAKAKANAKVLKTAFDIATDRKDPKCATMNIFWQKTRMGFREVSTHELTGKDGEPLPGPQVVVIEGK